MNQSLAVPRLFVQRRSGGSSIDTHVLDETNTNKCDNNKCYRVYLANSHQEIVEAQRFRYRIFAEEMGVSLAGGDSGLDADRCDNFCEHVLVRLNGELVGNTRVLTYTQASHAGAFYIVGAVLSIVVLWPMSWISHPVSWYFQSTIIRLWNRLLSLILGLRVSRTGLPNTQPSLFVANHISWLDIVGLLVTGRCALGSGRNVYIFPEGTSTDGSKVRPFFPRLFKDAVQSGAPIQAIAISYTRDGGLDATAPFIDDDDFADHLLQVVSQPYTDLSITFSPSISPDMGDRRTLAKYMRQQIEQTIGNAEKAKVVSGLQSGQKATGSGQI
jgi:1-acyl-sn-glycerol-3-phosphate acyltransferase